MSEAGRVRLRTVINGEPHDIDVDPRSAVVDVLRDDLDMTGTKLVCGAGVCGACTVIKDGRPATACTLPACAMDGAELQTVEGLEGPDGLHPVQKAFLAHDGLQCGYCTPGFIVEAVAFCDAWRAKHGATEPPREAISYALSGHLCRCGAYVGIYAAVAAACRGDFDSDAPFDYPRHEGPEKVTGRARYTADKKLDGMLIAKLLGSPHAHAKVVALQLDAARALPGVEAVIDVIDDPHRVARYAGYPLVAVAAVDEETAHKALQLVEVEYETRPFVVDPSDALQPDAPEVFPESDKHPKNASEGPIPPASWNGNIRVPVLNKLLSHHKSQAQKHLARARDGKDELVLVDRVYHTGGQTHATLETHCAIAQWDGDHLTVHTSIQSVHQTMLELADHFELKPAQVSVHSEFIGGAFGGKQGIQLEAIVAAQLAKEAGRPVKLVLDREEEMVRGGYRPLTRFELAVVSNADLEPLGITFRGYGVAGVAVQSQAAALLRLTYEGPKNLQDFDIVTNTGPGRPMRAPSGPPAFWALESALDELAHATGSDPVALRRKWDDSDVREKLYDWVESIPEWKDRGPVNAGTGRFRRGIGFAIGNWANIFHNETKIRLDAGPDGVVARCAVQDMGNGARSVIAKAVAETLGIDFASVTVDIGVSDHPPGPNSSASRTTASVYPTSIEAAEFLQSAVVSAAKKAGLESPRWAPGGVQHEGGFVPLAEFLASLSEPISVTSKRRGGNSTLDLLGKLPSGRLGASFFPKMTGAVGVVAVEVDTKLGRVMPRKVWLGMSVGKIVNPALARSQAYGGVIQSLGAALTEERHYDPATGQLLSANLEDYRLPGMGDVPPIDVFFDESKFTKMRGGACGLSELSAIPTQAALGNAVFHATGWRPTHIPLRPQRVQTNVAHLAKETE